MVQNGISMLVALKTILFFLLVPVLCLGVAPALIIRPNVPLFDPGLWRWAAVPLWLAGWLVLVWCCWSFTVHGRGTPNPLDPPKELVISGLYHFVRNPMYVGALLVQVGTIIWFGTLAQVVYWFFLFIGFNLFIRANEEPYLRKTFGTRYEAYCQAMPRWIPRGKRTG